MKTLTVLLALAVVSPVSLSAAAGDTSRQAEVREKGKDVMPFSVEATTHVFTKTTDGGVQRVVARDMNDAATVKLVRAHLHEIQHRFGNGDFGAPSDIHGQDMPGLAELRSAKPGQVRIAYRDVKAGAELAFKTSDPALVTALHRWFDAQLSDHGRDAIEGHQHDHGSMQAM